MKRNTRIALITGIAALAAGVALTWVVRDQLARARRALFGPHAIRRLAALSHLTRADASVDLVTLLRDFIAWEPRPLLRSRAQTILERMLDDLEKGINLVRAG